VLLLLLAAPAGCGFVTRPAVTQVTRVAALEMHWQGRAREALERYEARVRALEAEGPTLALLNAYMAAAAAAGALGRYEAQLDWAQKAVRLTETGYRIPVSFAAVFRRYSIRVEALGELASAYENLARWDEAEQAIRQGLEAADDVAVGDGPWLWKAWMKEKLAVHLRRQGKGEEALALNRQALAAREGIRFWADLVAWAVPQGARMARRWATNSNLDVARALLGLGRHEEAAPYVDRALALARRAAAPGFEASALRTRASIQYRRGAFEDALASNRQALALQEAVDPDGTALAFTHAAIGWTLRALARTDEALAAFREAIRRNEDFREVFASARSRSVVFERRLGAYHGAALALTDLGRSAEAFDLAERVRARAFLDVLALRATLARPARGDLVDEERRLRARVEEVRALPESGPAAGERARLLAEARAAYERFLERLQREDAEQASLRSVEPLGLHAVQALLEPGTGLLEYLVTDEGTLAWLVTRDRMRAARIPLGEAALRAGVERLREAIAARDEAATMAESATLGARLLDLLDGEGDLRRLIVVPHGPLHYLPFQALRRPGRGWLVEDLEVTTLPSASVLRFTREKVRARPGPMLAVGNPDLRDPFLDLRWAEREARFLGEQFPDAVVLIRADASRANVLERLPGARYLHFATHAELSEDDPLGSAIRLAPAGAHDGRLEVQEIYGWDLGTELVVLSACETGLGEVSQGDEIVGMTRAFIYAGAPSVITTLWRVDDRASFALMRRFYRALARGEGKAAALRRAQLDTLAEFPHPYFWAAYQLTGEPR
jgi:CHAT domain-containing protein